MTRTLTLICLSSLLLIGCDSTVKPPQKSASPSAAKQQAAAAERKSFGGAESPQALHAASCKAIASGQAGVLYEHWAPATRGRMLLMMVVGGGFLASGNDEAKLAYEALNKKHRLSQFQLNLDDLEDEQKAAALVDRQFKGVDRRALMADLISMLEKHGKRKLLGNALTQLKIDGERATARNGRKQVKFVKVDGRWFYGG